MGRRLEYVRPDAPKGLSVPHVSIYDRTEEGTEHVVMVDRNAVAYALTHLEETLIAYELGRGPAPRGPQLHRDTIKVLADALGRKS